MKLIVANTWGNKINNWKNCGHMTGKNVIKFSKEMEVKNTNEQMNLKLQKKFKK